MIMENLFELIEMYSKGIGLPIFLIERNGQIEHQSVQPTTSSINDFTSTSFQEEAINIALYINKPTIFTAADEKNHMIKRFVLTPLFVLQNDEGYLMAGPFAENSCSTDKTIPILNEKERMDVLNKMESLSYMISNIWEQKQKAATCEKLIGIITAIREYNCEIDKFEQFISDIFDRILMVGNIDFVGYSIKNDDNTFSINMIKGEHVQELQGKNFYIGEGFLGKAIVMEQNIFWNSNGDDLHRAEFFYRYGIKPSQLFCFPLKIEGKIYGIFFGGSFKKNVIGKDMLEMLRIIVYFISEKKITSARLKTLDNKQQIFNSLVEMMYVSMHSTDLKNLMYSVLDFCYTLNQGRYVCITLKTGEHMSRGETNRLILELHNSLWNQLLSESSPDRSSHVNQNYLHQPIFNNEELYGLLSVEFLDRSFLERITVLFEMITTLIDKNVANSQDTISSSNRGSRPESKAIVDPYEKIEKNDIEKISDLKSVIMKLALTYREKEILHLILEGLNNQEVGNYLKISVHTVKNHVTNIFKKLNVTDRVHAMAKIYRIKYGED